MKTHINILLIFLVSSLTFACAQNQDNEANNRTANQDTTQTAIKFNAEHDRGNEEARTSPNAAVQQTVGTTPITITYGRPGVKGRTIFGDLEAYGEIWRTGANESTVISFPKDVTVEGQSLEAGTYSLYTIPGQDAWTIVFNSKFSWGTEYDKSKDVLRVETEPTSASAMEQFMIYFQNVTDTSAEVVLHWNETKVSFTVEV